MISSFRGVKVYPLRAHTTKKKVLTDSARTILPVEFGQVTLPLIESINNGKDGGFCSHVCQTMVLGTKTRRLIRNDLHVPDFGVI